MLLCLALLGGVGVASSGCSCNPAVYGVACLGSK